MGFTSSSQLCYPQAQCDDGVFGCETDDDCKDGLECVGEGSNRKCTDINQCTDIRFKDESEEFCGPNAVCENEIGLYKCNCVTGI